MYVTIGVLVGVVAVLLYLFLLLRRSLPGIEGTAFVRGLDGTVDIIRDADGVPHVRAGTRRDAYYGLGYVHAQDRLWQMERQRRIATGTLAEIFGKRAVAADRYTRTLALHEHAQRSWPCLDPSIQADILAYVGGINGFIANARAHGPEFTLMRFSPGIWSTTDVLSIGKLLGWMVCGSHVSELLRFDLTQVFGEQHTRWLLHDYAANSPPVGPVAFRPGAEPADHNKAAEPHPTELTPEEGRGSNLWIVNAARSASGHAVLANDPHLSTSAPGPLYIVNVECEELHFAGASLPGIPAVISGRNRSIAWGVTSMAPDVQDLYWEKLDASGTCSQYGAAQEPLSVRSHEIRVKGAPAVDFEAQWTARGPLISQILQGDTEEHRKHLGARPPLSLQWTGFCENDRSVEALMRLNAASSWEEFNAALRLHVVPPLNFGFLDKNDNIGLHAAGLIPVRRSGDGSIPADGSSPECGWKGFIPYDELPQCYNPSCGYIISINSSAPEPDYPHFLGRDWIGAARKERIRTLIEARARLCLEDHRAIQHDSVSSSALRLLEVARPLLNTHDTRSREALAFLERWDADMHQASVAAAIFAAWHFHATQALLHAVMGEKLTRAYQYWISYTSQFLLDALTGAITLPIEPGRLASEALAAAVAELTKRFGPNMNRWRWGKMHRAVFPHSPFHYVPFVRQFFSREGGCAGYFDTVGIGGVSPTEPYTTRHIAAYQQIVDLHDPAGSLYCLSLGQSGHFLSRHYDYFLDDWCAGRQRKFEFQTSAVNEAHRLTLLPGRSGT